MVAFLEQSRHVVMCEELYIWAEGEPILEERTCRNTRHCLRQLEGQTAMKGMVERQKTVVKVQRKGSALLTGKGTK